MKIKSQKERIDDQKFLKETITFDADFSMEQFPSEINFILEHKPLPQSLSKTNEFPFVFTSGLVQYTPSIFCLKTKEYRWRQLFKHIKSFNSHFTKLMIDNKNQIFSPIYQMKIAEECDSIFKSVAHIHFQELKCLIFVKVSLKNIQVVQLLSCPSLKELHLNDNQICDIKSVRKSRLPELTLLLLQKNNIKEMSPLTQALIKTSNASCVRSLFPNSKDNSNWAIKLIFELKELNIWNTILLFQMNRFLQKLFKSKNTT